MHLALYDAFEPPRLVGVSTISIGDIQSNGVVNFEFNEKIELRSSSLLLFAESNVFHSDFVSMKIPEPHRLTTLATISNLSITDSQGNTLSEIPVNSAINIQSQASMQLLADSDYETTYTYYVQVKQCRFSN